MIPWNYKDLAAIKQMADIVEEVEEGNIYLGFKEPGGPAINEDEPRWSIMNIRSDNAPGTYPRVTTFKFANGTFNFDKSWESRASYDYEFRNWS